MRNAIARIRARIEVRSDTFATRVALSRVGDEAIELTDVALHAEIKTTFGLTLKPSKLLQDIN